ncbi:MAG: histidine kinase [Flavobacterium sp.]|nr:MAG: histidine kinase [Flavobacterium sp.]
MRILAVYQNFYTRNILLLLFFIGVIFSAAYNGFNDYPEAQNHDALWLLTKIVTAIVPIFLLMIISNTFIVKPLFLNRRYKLFVFSFLVYWLCAHYFLSWYFVAADLGKHKILATLSTLSNGTGFYFLHLWILRNVEQGRKEIIHAEAELSFLKQQLNPHFLLNAMNNLYGESLSEPDMLPERILNLCGMLRYQIEASKKDFVLLEEEIGFVKQYVDYFRFRNERLEVIERFDGEYGNIQVPPLLLLPLVENAIKFSGETERPFIRLQLSVKGKGFTFSLENTYPESGSRQQGTGIGIVNLERRLEVYGLKHEFIYSSRKGLYCVNLKLWNLSTAVL